MQVQKMHHDVQDGWHKQENRELHILNVLCLKCLFLCSYEQKHNNLICLCFDAPIITKRQDGDQDGRRNNGNFLVSNKLS